MVTIAGISLSLALIVLGNLLNVFGMLGNLPILAAGVILVVSTRAEYCSPETVAVLFALFLLGEASARPLRQANTTRGEHATGRAIAAFGSCVAGLITGSMLSPSWGMVLGGAIGMLTGAAGYEYRRMRDLRHAVFTGLGKLLYTLSPTLVRLGTGIIMSTVLLLRIMQGRPRG